MFSSRRFSTFLIALVSVCLVSSMAYAEDVDRPTGLNPGANVLSFGFPAGGSNWGGTLGSAGTPSIAFFHNFDPQVQFGGGLGLMYDDDLFFELNPTLKFFLSTTERAVPYVYGQVDLGYDSNDFDFGLGFGLGAEFFPVPEISVGGRVGFSLLDSAGSAGGLMGMADMGDGMMGDPDFATVVSGLDLNFYF